MQELTLAGKRLVVGGCLAAIAPDEIASRFPQALVLDTMGLDSLSRSLSSLARGNGNEGPSAMFRPSPERIDTIVPISTGCMGSCSYCITRLARGCVRSYPVEDIICRINSGIMEGRMEVLLTSQDSAAYGMDQGSRDLGSLLRTICSSIDRNARIRVGMMNPLHTLRALPGILRGFDHPVIFRFFHVPVQSGSDEVLSRMHRGYDTDAFRKMVDGIRSRYPEASISTDVIIGFPGETEEDHRMTLDMIEGISPDILNITRFSPRPGTEAFGTRGHVKGWVLKERSREATKLHQEILGIRLVKRMGHHQDCLVTEVGKKGTMMARDSNYTPIVIEGGRELLGTFIDVDTSGAGPGYLLGGREWKVC